MLQHGLLSANAIVAEDAEIDGLVPWCYNSNGEGAKNMRKIGERPDI